jgi:hypothetical protein
VVGATTVEHFDVITVRWSRTFVARWFPAGAVALAIALLLCAGACSSSPSPHPSAGRCGKSTCSAGTACVDDGSDAGPSCQKLCTRQSDCPFNSYCNDAKPHAWCAQSTLPVPQFSGQFGDPCLPTGGENNAACDTVDTFGCYGISPTDANAFCTILDCTADSDCKGGWWCATIDVAPNVSSTTRSFGKSRTACLPRTYCASCQSDHDCSAAPDGQPQHCVPDSAGGSFCSNACGKDANCPLDAQCKAPWAVCAPRTCANDGDCQKYAPKEACFGGTCQLPCNRDTDCPPSNGLPQHCDSGSGACVPQSCNNDDDCPPAAGTFQHCNVGTCTPECGTDSDCNPDVGDQTCAQPLKVCTPRAGVCVGDGSFCSPCRADADCHNGYCLAAAYSTERFCSQNMKLGTSCLSTGPPSGSCPMRPSTANYKGVACTQSSSDTSPANQCIGFVTFGTASNGQPQIVPGCWTVNR